MALLHLILMKRRDWITIDRLYWYKACMQSISYRVLGYRNIIIIKLVYKDWIVHAVTK